MQLLAPDTLREVRALSPVLTGTGLVVGLFLWVRGGWTHRFWLALVMTLTAGVLGLFFGPDYGMQPLVAGLLLAVAVGALALSLVRILLFAAGGVAALWVARQVAPAWDEPLACFLSGGLVGVLLYRFWITTLASLAGTLLVGYCGLALLARFTQADTIAWAGRNAPLLNWSCAALAAMGVLVQFLLDRRSRRKLKKKLEPKEVEVEVIRRPMPKQKKAWWPWAARGEKRRAG